ncbi:MAG: shikimate dehydrogenase family protein [Planctomycetota bacterium]|jgi:3-dehydroquinate dehydratase/shikimate dehydrogenase
MLLITSGKAGLDYVRESRGFVEPLAEKIGAANTVLIGPDGKLGAYNTDYAGAMDAITSVVGSRVNLNDMGIAVIGAGGAARAIVAGLSDAGAKVTIYNRTVKKAERLAGEFRCEFAPLNDLPKLDAELVINCTSIGMHPNTNITPLPQRCIKKDMVVFDTVYNPAETLLLEGAKEAGAKTISGLEMFVNQALAQFRLFTGQEVNAELVRKIARDSM